MPVYLGTTNITNIRVGAAAASKVYLGATQVWPAAATVPVAFKSSLGTAVATVSGSTLVITTTAAIAVDDLVVVRVAADNLSATTPTFTCADSGGNTYTVHREGAFNATAAAGIAGAIICAKATSPIAAGGTITVTLSGAVVARAVYAESFTGAANTTRSTPVYSTATNGALAPGATGTVNAGDLLLAWGAWEHSTPVIGDTDTLNGAWSTIVNLANAVSVATTRVNIAGQYKLATGAGAQTWAATGGSSDCLGGVVVLQAALSP